MPNPTVGLHAGYAGTVCGYYDNVWFDNRERIVLTLNETPAQKAIGYFLDDINAINIDAHRGQFYCVDYDSMVKATETSDLVRYELTGARYKKMLCEAYEFLHQDPNFDACMPCQTGTAGLSMRDMSTFYLGAGFYHANTACNYCMSGYYRDGSNCVSCPGDNMPEFANSSPVSWGDGGVETCFAVITDAMPDSVVLSDKVGTYVQSIELNDDFTSVMKIPVAICPYKL